VVEKSDVGDDPLAQGRGGGNRHEQLAGRGLDVRGFGGREQSQQLVGGQIARLDIWVVANLRKFGLVGSALPTR